jgi:hypothetical protein
MSRKPLLEGQRAPRGDSLNSLIKQLEDPRSLMSFLPPDVQKGLAEIPEHYLDLDENELLKLLDEEWTWQPTVAAELLRRNFWMEHDRVQFSKLESLMNMSNIYLGVVTREHWHRIVHEHSHIAAFILCRPPEYKMSQEALQNHATRKFFEILSLPIKEKGGRVDIKLLELQMKTAAMIDMRNQGGFTQRSETKNLNLIKSETNHTYSAIISGKGLDGKTAAEIEMDVKEKLAMLEEEARMQLPPPSPQFEKTEEIVVTEYTDVTPRET